MSIASHFRAKMDVVLASADQTVGKDADHRRTMLMQSIDAADMMLVEKDYVATLFATITDLRNEALARSANA